MASCNLFFAFSLAALSILTVPAALGQPPATSPVSAARSLLTGYFPQWGLYNDEPYIVKNLVTTGGAAMLDQLNYAQAFVTGGHCSIADPNADLNFTFTAEQSVNGIADNPTAPFRGNLHQLVALKRLYPHLKLIISLEGRSTSFAEDAQPQNREAFVNSCVDIFLKGNLAPDISAPELFDGIDVDWEYPHKEDAANYIALLAMFRSHMDALRPGLLLNIAVGGSPRVYEGTDWAAVSQVVDQVGLMTYDFAGPWSGTTGFIAPLRIAATHNNGTIEDTVREYRAAGVPASQLLVGLPFYGYGWHLVEETDNGLFQEGDAIRGDHPYRDIQAIAQHSTVYRADDSKAPWLFDGDAFWTYDDPVSIQRKAEYIHEHALGGFMIWELGEDTTDGLLLRSAHRGLTSAAVSTAAPSEASPDRTSPTLP